MRKRTFVGDLVAELDEDELAEARTEPAALLNWMMTQVLLGRGVPQQAVKWLAEQKKAAGKKRKGDLPLWPLVRLCSVAAALELSGKSGDDAASAALDHILPASKKTDWERGVSELVSCALALLIYFQEEGEAAAWNEKRLGQIFPDAAALSMFQVLYLSSAEAAEDDLERLALETARVCVHVIESLSNQYVAPLVLTLAPRADAEDKSLLELFSGAAAKLDDLAGSVELEEPRFELVGAGDSATLRMIVVAKGEGSLIPGVQPMASLTSHFAETLSGYLTQTRKLVEKREQSGKLVLAALARTSGRMEVVLKLASSRVHLAPGDRDALRRRFQVAFRHAKATISKLCCSAELVFEGA